MFPRSASKGKLRLDDSWSKSLNWVGWDYMLEMLVSVCHMSYSKLDIVRNCCPVKKSSCSVCLLEGVGHAKTDEGEADWKHSVPRGGEVMERFLLKDCLRCLTSTLAAKLQGRRESKNAIMWLRKVYPATRDVLDVALATAAPQSPVSAVSH